VTVAKWSAERIGPMIIAAPHRGHAHVALAGVSVVGGAVVSVAGADGEGEARTVRRKDVRSALLVAYPLPPSPSPFARAVAIKVSHEVGCGWTGAV
jgi:hypothetical protein